MWAVTVGVGRSGSPGDHAPALRSCSFGRCCIGWVVHYFCNMATTSSSFVRPLFGGAVTCNIPDGFVDISDFRQVPSDQECWGDTAGRLLVMEILEQQTSIPNDGAAEFFFRDLAESNGITSPEDFRFSSFQENEQFHPVQLPPQSVFCFGKGFQRISRGKDNDLSGNSCNSQDPRWVGIDLGLIRLPSVQAEILVTLSVSDESNPQETTATSELFRRIFSSIQIQDWGLFGGTSDAG